MGNKPEEIVFKTDAGEDVIFQVLEQTRLAGVDYLLVSPEAEDEEGEVALILKDISEATDEEAIYDIVEEDAELELVAAIFQELLEDEIELS